MFDGLRCGEQPRVMAGMPLYSSIITVVSLAIFTLLFSEIYRVLPDATISWRHLVLISWPSFAIPADGITSLALRFLINFSKHLL